MRLKEEFFARKSKEVAKDLIGRKLVRELGKKRYTGIITETGAYEGGKHEGLTNAPGKIYVAIFKGGYATLAIGTEKKDKASVVTIRKVYPIEGTNEKIIGSGTLTRAFEIGKELDGASIESNELYIEGNPADSSNIQYISPKMTEMAKNCLGYYKLK